MNHQNLAQKVREIVEKLVLADYEGLEALSQGRRLTAEEMKEGVEEYGRTLTFPPESAYDNLDVIEVKGVIPKKWNIRINLWSVEEGMSDLALILTLREKQNDAYDVEIDDILVP